MFRSLAAFHAVAHGQMCASLYGDDGTCACTGQFIAIQTKNGVTVCQHDVRVELRVFGQIVAYG